MWLKNHDHSLVNMHCNVKLCFDGIFNHILANKMTVFFTKAHLFLNIFLIFYWKPDIVQSESSRTQ